MNDRTNNSPLPLHELYAEFAGHHEHAHDLIYCAIRKLLKHHHPAALLMIVQGAMQDELDAPHSDVDYNQLMPYAVLLAEMVERLYIEEQFYGNKG
ncbi:MAG: hypothetical protein VKL39_05585 [Leptolyngbyaceae bacterium]|nr:hypothetical protein [Leptolyngbyaceae bacterium]